ncbi:Tn3 family transposase [Streptomyces janthinus]|uniref:Tn3 family transposase n=1 Tax=Streptomyces violaceus TaxID=1936 RepID=A0ABY9TZR3_STRVL|nr:transposase [Streptomyces janthinus]WND15902.1 Tn3 family transposase [Streptomyces janthinus]GGS98536.1 hypothetical protein GCM10010270_83150 [Streptomyces janthinus]
MLWTTRYIDAAVAQFQAEGHEIREEDITRLSLLKHRNLNLLGRYSFTASTPAAVALRPLSDADALELDEDDEGGETERPHRVTRAYRVAGCSEIASAGREADVRLPDMSD